MMPQLSSGIPAAISLLNAQSANPACPRTHGCCLVHGKKACEGVSTPNARKLVRSAFSGPLVGCSESFEWQQQLRVAVAHLLYCLYFIDS